MRYEEFVEFHGSDDSVSPMEVEIIEEEYFEIDGDHGCVIVPLSALGGSLADYREDIEAENWSAWADYYEGLRIDEVKACTEERLIRLSMPGYLDCTEWDVLDRKAPVPGDKVIWHDPDGDKDNPDLEPYDYVSLQGDVARLERGDKYVEADSSELERFFTLKDRLDYMHEQLNHFAAVAFDNRDTTLDFLEECIALCEVEAEDIIYKTIGDGSILDIAKAVYWTLADCHGGQNSREYALLSRIGSSYSPGMGECSPKADEDVTAAFYYQQLCVGLGCADEDDEDEEGDEDDFFNMKLFVLTLSETHEVMRDVVVLAASKEDAEGAVYGSVEAKAVVLNYGGEYGQDTTRRVVTDAEEQENRNVAAAFRSDHEDIFDYLQAIVNEANRTCAKDDDDDDEYDINDVHPDSIRLAATAVTAYIELNVAAARLWPTSDAPPFGAALFFARLGREDLMDPEGRAPDHLREWVYQEARKLGPLSVYVNEEGEVRYDDAWAESL